MSTFRRWATIISMGLLAGNATYDAFQEDYFLAAIGFAAVAMFISSLIVENKAGD